MKQLSIQVDKVFLQNLKLLMQQRSCASESEVIRLAVQEAVEFIAQGAEHKSLRQSLGIAITAGKLETKREFKSEEDLWTV